jgi:hypothetical protein
LAARDDDERDPPGVGGGRNQYVAGFYSCCRCVVNDTDSSGGDTNPGWHLLIGQAKVSILAAHATATLASTLLLLTDAAERRCHAAFPRIWIYRT